MTDLPNAIRFLLLLVVMNVAAGAWAENWPGWRGPTGQGVSTETGLPVLWDRTTNVRWKVALPDAGNSTPIIWGDRIFVSQAHEKSLWPPKVPANYAGGASAGGFGIAEKRSVLCFRRADGKLLWQQDTVYEQQEMTHPTNPFCSASPVTDGERVIASHGSAGVVAYDYEGNTLWHYDVGKLEHLWGNASSPILYDNLCILWCGPGDRQFLLALDKKSGEKVWETPAADGDSGITTKNFLGSWSTPLVARVGEADELIFPLPHQLHGYDPRTGKELWSARVGGTYCYHSPLYADGVAIFGDSLVQLGGRGDISSARLGHKVGSMFISTAVLHGDYLYAVNNVGVPSCYQWKSGKELWKDQIEKRPGGKEAWGSVVYADGRIYLADRDGTTAVFAAGPEYKHLANNRLDEHTDASIAISGGDIFIRTHKHLWCIGEAVEPAADGEPVGQ